MPVVGREHGPSPATCRKRARCASCCLDVAVAVAVASMKIRTKPGAAHADQIMRIAERNSRHRAKRTDS